MTDLLKIYQELQEKNGSTCPIRSGDSPHFPALPALEKKDIFTLKDGFHVQQFSVVGQYGTHLMLRFTLWKVVGLEEIELKDLFLPLVVMISLRSSRESRFILGKQDILDFEAEHGQIDSRNICAFRSNWSKRWPVNQLCAIWMIRRFSILLVGDVMRLEFLSMSVVSRR
ncbi:cyclase family protein [Streptococcus sanguinis]|uniref:Cyclase family protein n=1 Tax=Streptococcus sanguinis TaxID=1305 RepID=A0A7Y0YS17_STRSA|nr:cyclase family protein [Streptococcus sanguinis]